QNVTMSVVNTTGRIDGLAPARITYKTADLSCLTVKGGGRGNTFTVEDTFKNPSFGLTILDTCNSGDNTFVHATTGRLVINGQNGPAGENTPSDIFPAGSLGRIQGEIDVTNSLSFTRLTVNGAADNFTHTVILTATSTLGQIFGLAPALITYLPN